MEVDEHTANIIRQTIKDWEANGKLSKEQASGLRNDIQIKKDGRKQAAVYFFFIAICCTLLAFGAIFINEKLLEKIKAYFSWGDLAISFMAGMVGGVWLWYISKRRKMISQAAYEACMVSGGLLALTSLLYACKEMQADTTYTIFLALSFTVLAVLGVLLISFALYTGAIIAIIVWYGIFTTGQGSDNLFLGMNYPLRYTVLGMCILALSLLQRRIKPGHFTGGITYFTGLTLFFTGLWALSVFGNYNTLAQWHSVRQIHVLAYAIIFAVAAVTSFIAGIRYRDTLARDMGVLFLLINLYTRYFEYFWDSMNKGIFFLILAITCSFLGWWLDKGKSIRRHKNTPRS